MNIRTGLWKRFCQDSEEGPGKKVLKESCVEGCDQRTRGWGAGDDRRCTATGAPLPCSPHSPARLQGPLKSVALGGKEVNAGLRASSSRAQNFWKIIMTQ